MNAGTISGGRVLTPAGFETGPVRIRDGRIEARDASGPGFRLDATDLLVLPGIVDAHGDAFERQLMPRPGVGFPVELALLETDRQLIANGITTAFHSVTWSWEPGLRDSRMARLILDAIERLGGELACDTRFHLRHEAHNLDAEPEILDWIAARRIAVLSFNDHVHDVRADIGKGKQQKYLDRTGLDGDGWRRLFDEVAARGDEVPASIERLAAAGRAAAIPMMSHDDLSPETRDWFHARGVRVCEFPETEATAARARAHGDHVVFGAPNVVRGGSHTTAPNASEMVAKGLGTVLASDYYYPALALAPFRLVERGITEIAAAWPLVSTNPAEALGLDDRGALAPGKRADIALVDARGAVPRVVATIVAGRIVHLAEGRRLG